VVRIVHPPILIARHPTTAPSPTVASGGTRCQPEGVNVLALGGSDCETVRDALLGQPVNAVSSLAYVAGAAVVLWRGGPPVPALALAAVGVGSFLYHGPMPAGAEAVHDGTIVALAAVTAAAAWRRRPLRRPPALAVATLAAAVTLNLLSRTGAPLCQPDSLAQGHAAWHVLTAAAAAMWLATWTHPARHGHRWVSGRP
jgi:hypothetical protein